MYFAPKFGGVLSVGLLLTLAAPVGAQTGPDVIVGDLQSASSWGFVGDIFAYSVGTTSCNVGTAPLSWFASTNNHPVIAQRMYRLKDDRLEQIGTSWLKHGFCALAGDVCDNCTTSADCDFLWVNCSDPYTSSRNGQQSNLGPPSQVNAFTGAFPYPFTAPGAAATIGRRLQVHRDFVDPALNAGALYFVEGQYVTPDDALAGNGENNFSHRRMQVGTNPATYPLSTVPGASTVRELPALYAWTGATIEAFDAPGEGQFLLGYKVTDLGGGMWHYEYALLNVNSDVCARSFNLPIPTSATLSNIAYHSVPHHSGEPYSNAPWPGVQTSGAITWSTSTFAVDPNASALRWGRMVNFRFDANTPPELATATVGLFKTVGSVNVSVLAPSGASYPPPINLVCSNVSGGVQLTWLNGAVYTSLTLERNGLPLATLGGATTSYLDTTAAAGLTTYELTGTDGIETSPTVSCVITVPPQLAFQFPGGLPSLVSTFGQSFPVVIVEQNGGVYESGSGTLFLDSGSGFTPIALVPTGTLTFAAQIPAAPCGTALAYYLSAETTSGLEIVSPSDAPSSSHAAIVADSEEVVVTYDMESASGWTAGVAGDTATLGQWVRVDPVGTAAQPEDDHSAAPGTFAWVTGQGTVGGGIGAADVDSGTTTLVSPPLDLLALNAPTISYWRWYSNDEGASPSLDVFVVQISANGTTWVTVETVGPTGAEASGSWFQHTFDPATFITLGSAVHVRFIANDAAPGSIIEAAIDDFEVHDVTCASGPVTFVRGDCNDDGGNDIADATFFLSVLFSGVPMPDCVDACDSDDSGSLNIADVIFSLTNLFEGGSPPPLPFPSCGTDPTSADPNDCASFDSCP
ncbi:MAG: hypothetical protein ACKVX7_18350 [Planctomycetota bacterium]